MVVFDSHDDIITKFLVSPIYFKETIYKFRIQLDFVYGIQSIPSAFTCKSCLTLQMLDYIFAAPEHSPVHNTR